MDKKKLSEKQTKTIAKMKEIRATDSIHLREIIKDKLDWAKKEKEKTIALINKHKETINELNIHLLKIEGAIIFINDILNPEEKKVK